MSLDPTNGEAAMTDAPVWGGRGGEIQAAKVYAWGQFGKLFGRNPTQSELSLLASAYVGADRNIANVGGGDAAVAQYYQTQLNDPSRQKKKEEDDQAAKIPQQYDAVKGAFQGTLGRDPSQQELDHFAKMMASGDADAYSIQQGLETLPEYTQPKDEAARTKLRGELQTADTDYLTKQVAPALQSKFAQAGRVADSSSQALAGAFANAAKETNNTRENYLATVGREDYTNSRQSTINNYLQTLQRQYQVNDSSTARYQQLTDQNTARNYDMQDYYMQQAAYNDYLQNNGRRSGGGGNNMLMGGLQGGISGASTGAMVGGPWGAVIGGVAGAGLGAYGGSKQRSIY